MTLATIRQYIQHSRISLFLFLGASIQILFSSWPLVSTIPLFDFDIYRIAANQWISGQNPYQVPFGQGIGNIPFNYPPASLYFFALFSQLPFPAGQMIFSLLSYMAFCAAMYIAIRIVRPETSRPWALAIIAFTLLTFPFKLTLVIGQVNSFVLLLIVMSFFLYARQRRFLSALLLALAGCLKLYPLFLLTVYLVRKDVRYFLLTIGMFLLMHIPQLTLSYVYFAQVLPHLLSSTAETTQYNQSVFALFIRVTDNPENSRVLANGIIALFIAAALAIYRRSKIMYPYFALLAILSIAGQFSWQHHLMYTYPFLILRIRRTILLLFIFPLFAIHFLDPNSPLLSNPYIVSYQTISIMLLISLIFCIDTRKIPRN